MLVHRVTLRGGRGSGRSNSAADHSCVRERPLPITAHRRTCPGSLQTTWPELGSSTSRKSRARGQIIAVPSTYTAPIPRAPGSVADHYAAVLPTSRAGWIQSMGAGCPRRKILPSSLLASCKQAPRSSGLGEELGESDLAELDGAGHQPASTEGHTPAARARDLGDQPVGMQPAQQAGDLAGLLFWLFGEREWSPSEVLSPRLLRLSRSESWQSASVDRSAR